MTEPHEELYGTIVELRNTELNMLWIRFNIHLLVNGGFLVAFLTAGNGLVLSLGRAPHIFGLALALLWLSSEIAGRSALNHRD